MIDKTLCFIDDIQYNNKNECENYMTKSNKKQTNDAKIEQTNDDKILCVADVARELNIDAKRARAFLRKNVELYVARQQKFTRNSSLYKKTYDALMTYKNKNRVVTQ